MTNKDPKMNIIWDLSWENRVRGGEIDLPSIHGEISVEHLLAHLLPLNSPGKFQVRELISQQVGLHETLEEGRTAAGVSQADKKTGKDFFGDYMKSSSAALFSFLVNL